MSRETGNSSTGQLAALVTAASGSGKPREGSRETNEGIIISVPDDWCKSPTNPVPYTIWARQKDAGNLATTVRQTDNCSHVMSSLVDSCYGDEGGTGGGVLSGTHNAECTPKTWSATVRFEGRNTVRHNDAWWMNRRNTWGRLTYLKDLTHYATPAAPLVQAAMGPGTRVDAPSNALEPATGEAGEKPAEA